MKDKTYEEKIVERRIRYNKSFKNSPHSPLLEAQKKTFTELEMFPIDEKYRIITKFIENENPDEITILASKGDERRYIQYGFVVFEIDGVKNQLTILKPPQGDYLFLPFKDATTGKETYKNGRYLDVNVQPNGDIILDFNTAYNPYCAYNNRFSCTRIPSENILQVPIRAGEMKFGNYIDSE